MSTDHLRNATEAGGDEWLVEQIGEMRKAVYRSQAVAGEQEGLSPTTINSYENHPGQWLNPIKYIRSLARKSPKAQRVGLRILGLPAESESPLDDPQVRQLAELIAAARRYSDWPNRLWQIENALGLHGRPAPRMPEQVDGPKAREERPVLRVANEEPADYGGAEGATPATAPGRRSRE